MAAASAYPHHFYNPYYGLPVVPQPYPMVVPEPAPLARTSYQDPNYLQDEQTARYLINFEAFQRVQGVFEYVEEDGTDDGVTAPTSGTAHTWYALGQLVLPTAETVPTVQTVTGSASFYQNPFTGTNSKYRIDLTGMTAGEKYVIGLQDDCAPFTVPNTMTGAKVDSAFEVCSRIPPWVTSAKLLIAGTPNRNSSRYPTVQHLQGVRPD